MSSLESVLDQLKRLDFSTLELQTALNTVSAYSPLSDSDNLHLSLILLERVIPQAYILASNDIRKAIIELLATPIGINQLLRSIKEAASDETTKSEKVYSYVDILSHILEHKLEFVIDLFLNCKGTHNNNWRVFLTMKLTDVLGQVHLWLFDHPPNSDFVLNVNRMRVRQLMEFYTGNCVKCLAARIEQCNLRSDKTDTVQQILIFFLEKEPEAVFNMIIENWKILNSFFKQENGNGLKGKSKAIENKKRFMMGIFKAFNLKITDYTSGKLYSSLINNMLKTFDLVDASELILKSCEANTNYIASYAWIHNTGRVKKEHVLRILSDFGNQEYMSCTSYNLQIATAQYIVILLLHLCDEDIHKVSTSKQFLDTVSNRLESKLVKLRDLGMFIADFIYTKLNDKEMFNIPDYSKRKALFMSPLMELQKEFADVEFKSIDDVVCTIRSYRSITLVQSEETQLVDEKPLMVDISCDSDASDSDLDDPSVERKVHVTKPVFLKDLLHYLLSDPQKDKTAFEKRGIAFSIGIEMVRIKKGMPELTFYITRLIDAALDMDSTGFPLRSNNKLTDNEVDSAFNSWKLSFMIALCTSDFENAIDYLLKMFLKQDWSISTRIKVLTCIGLSCRELSGKHDDFIWGKGDLQKVKPKNLRGPGHEAFLRLDSKELNGRGIVDVALEEREKKVIDALEAVGIGEGKVVRRSRKLELDKQDNTKNNTVHTTFINKKLSKLYFSMVALWEDVNILTHGTGFNVGSMSEHLNSHYVNMLSMIYSCAVPSCTVLVDMSIEQIKILIGVSKSIQTISCTEFPSLLYEALVNGVKSLLMGNDRMFSVLKSNAPVEINTLFESFAQVSAMAPSMEEHTKMLSVSVLEHLRQYCLGY